MFLVCQLNDACTVWDLCAILLLRSRGGAVSDRLTCRVPGGAAPRPSPLDSPRHLPGQSLARPHTTRAGRRRARSRLFACTELYPPR
jgi:hypothetical protein